VGGDTSRHRGLDRWWGPYAAAIARWETLTRPAPPPTDPGGRLRPAFVEWMQGLPEGWVTATPGLGRPAQLTALGNGVIPQQASRALELLSPPFPAACGAVPRNRITAFSRPYQIADLPHPFPHADLPEEHRRGLQKNPAPARTAVDLPTHPPGSAMSDPTTAALEPEPFRIPDENLDDLATTLAQTMAEVRHHGVILDHLRSDPDNTPPAEPADDPSPQAEVAGAKPDDSPSSAFILALGGEAYATELAALADWVHYLFLPVYGREISTTRPWCAQWHEHPEAVARLHALWLAWQQLTDAEAGLTGPSTWHRDHLDQALVHLRAPDGPFAACTTSPTRPTHRVLATPVPQQPEVLA
jgi:hypothetical protein